MKDPVDPEDLDPSPETPTRNVPRNPRPKSADAVGDEDVQDLVENTDDQTVRLREQNTQKDNVRVERSGTPPPETPTDAVRAGLLTRRKAFLAILDKPAPDAGDLSNLPTHQADRGTDEFERDRDLGLAERATAGLRAVDAALDRLDQGTYGICTRCGKKIRDERLAADPTAAECMEHKA